MSYKVYLSQLMSDPKPHILQLITLAEIGGAQSHILTLIKGLMRDFRFSLGVGEEGFLSHAARELNCEVYIIPSLSRSLNPLKDLKALCDIKALIKSISPDLVHCHSSKAGALGRLAAWTSHKPVIFSAHGWAFNPAIPSLQRQIGLIAEAICARFCSRILCVSEYDRQLALSTKLFPKDKLIRLWNGIEDQQSPTIERNQGDKDKFIVLMIGRFARQKRQDLLIEACTMVFHTRAHQPSLELWLMGEGETRSDCELLAKRLNAPARFLGNRNDVASWIEQADVIALIADWEGLPISLLEGMRAGKPLLASAVGGVPELVVQGQAGLLVQNRIPDLQKALASMIEDTDLRARLGEGARKHFENYFTAEKMLQELKSIYYKHLPPSKC
ncbi:MAG: glycosyltransferase family 4 protein [Candidatus Caenarcaniphilales bacterium]|nr:glycosyltransferase family 4 protein [Candidatus Caenarcaniphilales bacterium]